MIRIGRFIINPERIEYIEEDSINFALVQVGLTSGQILEFKGEEVKDFKSQYSQWVRKQQQREDR